MRPSKPSLTNTAFKIRGTFVNKKKNLNIKNSGIIVKVTESRPDREAIE